MTDDQFIRAWHNGNAAAAFHWIWTAEYSRMIELGEALLEDLVLVEELVSTTFGNCWEMRANFQTAAQVRSFLRVSVRNACYDHMPRTIDVAQQDLKSLLNEYNFNLLQKNAFEKTYDEYLKKVYGCLKTLPDISGQVFRLSLIRHWPHGDIAVALDMEIQTVREQLFLAGEGIKAGMLQSGGNGYVLRLIWMALRDQGINLPGMDQEAGIVSNGS